MNPAPSFGKHGARSPVSRRLPSRVMASTSCLRVAVARCVIASPCAPAASQRSARSTSEDSGTKYGSRVAITKLWRSPGGGANSGILKRQRRARRLAVALEHAPGDALRTRRSRPRRSCDRGCRRNPLPSRRRTGSGTDPPLGTRWRCGHPYIRPTCRTDCPLRSAALSVCPSSSCRRDRTRRTRSRRRVSGLSSSGPPCPPRYSR